MWVGKLTLSFVTHQHQYIITCDPLVNHHAYTNKRSNSPCNPPILLLLYGMLLVTLNNN